jgi:cytochrome P450
VSDVIYLDRSFTRNPLDVLRRLQIEGPVARVLMWDRVPVWLVTRYSEARALLNDPRLSKSRVEALKLFAPKHDASYETDLVDNMLQKDPPDHTRLRKLVMKAFTPGVVAQMRTRITAIADGLLDEIEHLADRGPVDLVASYAMPLPVRVIGELLGVPDRYADEFGSVVVPIFDSASREEKVAASARANALLADLIDQKKRSPGEDLLSGLIGSADGGDRLSEEELFAMVFLLIAAGYETTAHLIANAVLTLLRNPDQLDELRNDPSLLPSAVEELLRFDSPVNVATVRFTSAPIRIGETAIPANEFVMISVLAANRDASQFREPDRLDIARRSNGHLAFGHGIHYCVGAPLARLEGEIALDRLLTRFDGITLDECQQLEYRHSTLVHGLMTLPVHLTNGPPRLRCKTGEPSVTN